MEEDQARSKTLFSESTTVLDPFLHYFEPTALSVTNSTVWNQQHCLEPTALSGTNSTVWNQQHCLEPTALSGTNSTVWNQQHCLEPTALFGTNSTVWNQQHCLEPTALFGRVRKPRSITQDVKIIERGFRTLPNSAVGSTILCAHPRRGSAPVKPKLKRYARSPTIVIDE